MGACWLSADNHKGHAMGKGCILWAVGIPIPIIILLYVFNIL
jgi:hypothetical protein